MLHIGIIPNYKAWIRFLTNLKYIVLDELHIYSGSFGSHFALVLRRLLRFVPSTPIFIGCSATIANPLHHFRTLIGYGESHTSLVNESTAPSGSKEFIVWKPTEGGSGFTDAARLMVFLLKQGIRTIAFVQYRKACELLMRDVRDRWTSSGEVGEVKCRSYRGGYMVEDRREVEDMLRRGDLLGVVSTNALELGIDIGGLDAVIHLGFPMTLSSLRQQMGRAGRKSPSCLSIFVPALGPFDNHFLNAPEVLFTKADATVEIEPLNEIVLGQHLQCAAFEKPLAPGVDAQWLIQSDHATSTDNGAISRIDQLMKGSLTLGPHQVTFQKLLNCVCII